MQCTPEKCTTYWITWRWYLTFWQISIKQKSCHEPVFNGDAPMSWSSFSLSAPLPFVLPLCTTFCRLSPCAFISWDCTNNAFRSWNPACNCESCFANAWDNELWKFWESTSIWSLTSLWILPNLESISDCKLITHDSAFCWPCFKSLMVFCKSWILLSCSCKRFANDGSLAVNEDPGMVLEDFITCDPAAVVGLNCIHGSTLALVQGSCCVFSPPTPLLCFCTLPANTTGLGFCSDCCTGLAKTNDPLSPIQVLGLSVSAATNHAVAPNARIALVGHECSFVNDSTSSALAPGGSGCKRYKSFACTAAGILSFGRTILKIFSKSPCATLTPKPFIDRMTPACSTFLAVNWIWTSFLLPFIHTMAHPSKRPLSSDLAVVYTGPFPDNPIMTLRWLSLTRAWNWNEDAPSGVAGSLPCRQDLPHGLLARNSSVTSDLITCSTVLTGLEISTSQSLESHSSL